MTVNRNRPWPWTKFLPGDVYATFAVVRNGRLRVLCDNTQLPDGRGWYWAVVERLESALATPPTRCPWGTSG